MKPRLQGVDAARGLALIGMMVIHLLPAWNADYEVTAAWSVFAGRGAALFALLAGVSLAFSAGGRRPVSGPSLFAARAALIARAVLVTLLGLAMGYVVIDEAVILAYYGVMFLLAVPFLGWSAKALAALAAGFVVLAPVMMQAIRDLLPPPGYDPTFTTLVTDPATAVSQLMFTGPYPAIPWMGYIFAGLALGRLDLRRRLVQLWLMAGGAALAATTWMGSALLLGPLGGRGILEASTTASDAAEFVNDTLIWGPDPTLPTDTWWWLAAISPYSSTPFEIAHTIGTSVLVLGLMLLLHSSLSARFSPLMAMGSMTLTLYTGHLLLLGTGLLQERPGAALLLHLVIAATVALLWRRFMGQGPLERAISWVARRVKSTALAAATRDANVKGGWGTASGAGDVQPETVETTTPPDAPRTP